MRSYSDFSNLYPKPSAPILKVFRQRSSLYRLHVDDELPHVGPAQAIAEDCERRLSRSEVGGGADASRRDEDECV